MIRSKPFKESEFHQFSFSLALFRFEKVFLSSFAGFLFVANQKSFQK
jgi:hypothetical protein